ncbi:MAG: PACE efflux transporter [Pseudomonadota bacterium]
MKKKIVVRTARDRLRYSLLFELVLIAILAPAGAMIFERHVLDIGLLSVVLSLKAMIVNLGYNWLFDLLDVRAGRVPTERRPLGRVLHAVGFECSLVLTSLPIVIWWLGLTLLEALIMDAVVTSLVVVYTILFGWCYDRYFPVVQSVAAGRA